MAFEDETIQPKPYTLVPFAGQSTRRTHAIGHQAIQQHVVSAVITLTLTTRKPLQVASGAFEAMSTRQGEQIVAMDSRIRRYDQDGVAQHLSVLPGSSFKGALRSTVEAISPACVVVNAGATRSAIPEQRRRCNRVDQLCPACRLFGMSGAGHENYQGQVSVEDGALIAGGRGISRVPLLWTPAHGGRRLPPRYLDRQDQVFGRKIYYHSQLAKGPDARLVLMSGAQLRVRLHIENLTGGELGLLVAALGLHPLYPFLIKIGAGKPIGMGSIEVQWERMQLHANVARHGRLGAARQTLDAAQLVEQAQTWVSSARQQQLLDEDALQTVQTTLHAGNLQRSPVEGAY